MKDLFRAICDDCEMDLGGWVSEAKAQMITAKHKGGEFYTKCGAAVKPQKQAAKKSKK